jgi:NAD(P)-dependent dehydrogenase (short-subunit alcohol dehydrogenase family)
VLSLITGVGAKGQVGEAVAGALAARGDTVLLVSRDASEVEARAAEIRKSGARATGYACDLSDAAAVDALAARVRSEHGDKLDALVNLAGGWASSGPMAKSDPAVFARMMQINATTAMLATRAFMPMLSAARGAIVFFASEVVVEGVRTSGVSAYAASKAAVVALMRSVADEGRNSGVRANALAPASIRTASNQSSMGADAKYVEREDVAATVAFLCSPAARAISGQVVRLH